MKLVLLPFELSQVSGKLKNNKSSGNKKLSVEIIKFFAKSINFSVKSYQWNSFDWSLS